MKNQEILHKPRRNIMAKQLKVWNGRFILQPKDQTDADLFKAHRGMYTPTYAPIPALMPVGLSKSTLGIASGNLKLKCTGHLVGVTP